MDNYIFERTVIKKLSTLRIVIHTKVAILLPCVLCVIVLSGCSAVGDFLLHQSGAMSEEEYQKYIELRKSGQLDKDGRYISAALDGASEFSPPADSIHVTFAKNAYITVQYYLDAEHKIPANPQKCYIKPGECIYISEPECHHPTSSYYTFDRFCIYSCDEKGNKSEEPFWQDGESSPLMALQVPNDYMGTELSVVPMGKYEKRQLTLSDYYTDSTGHSQELSGTWIVNDEETTDRTVEISPVEPLEIDCKYDPEKYCYVSSNPSSFYHDKGLVRFELVNATANIEHYSVELRSLTDETFLFDPLEYPVEHGDIIFEYLGRTINEPNYIPDGGMIQYTATSDLGYRHPKNTGKIIVNASNPDETKSQIREAVKFYSDENVEVILPRPDGGTIEYTANGEVLTGKHCSLPSGTVITMKFMPWNGWISKAADGAEYTVTEEKYNQTVALEGIDISNKVFTESPNHKPTLNVVLTDSAKDVKFDISAPGVGLQKDLSYAGGNKTTFIPDWLGQNDRIIFSDKVGTYPGINLTAKEDTILSGYALKLDLHMKDTQGNESNEIRYIKKLPIEKTIELYNKETVAYSSTLFETVTITISKVEVTSYSQKSIEHATITAMLTDMTTPYTLKDGDVLESSRNVNIAVTPEKGYYVIGAKNMGGTYSETIQYSKWQTEGQKILDKHPVKRIWYVTLNTTDSYGTCVYKLDGTVVSGQIGIREGQKLTLEYTLTSPNSKIVRNGPGGFFSGIIHNKTESCTIPVSEALDGRTIQRSDYIKVE